MKKILMAVLLLIAAGPLFAADPVTEIRAWYNKIQAEIKSQALFEIVLNTNNNKSPNPAVGPVVQIFTAYVYNTSLVDPEHPNSAPKGPLLITTRTTAAGYTDTREYLFARDGSLCFFFIESGKQGQERYYFKGGKLVFAKIGNKEFRSTQKNHQEAAALALEESKKFRAYFEKVPYIDWSGNREKYHE